jgi:sortase A
MTTSDRPPTAADRAGHRDTTRPDVRRSWSQRVVIMLACLAVAIGLLLAGSIALYLRHSSSTGTALAGREQRAIAKSRAAGGCTHAATPLVTSSDGQLVDAVLQVPKLGLVAPVFQGVDNPQLDIGIGHVPASSWPGFTGTDVLSAHDVTWFSHINQLSIGDRISMVTPCHTFLYTVVNHSVVNAGSPVFQSVHGRLVLVTCYPLNALFITPQRYLVEATLLAVTNSGSVTDPTIRAAPLPIVPAPAALVAQGLDLAHNEAPLGVLSLAGTPTPTWSQSPAPLQAEALALQLYFAALRSAGQDQASWWNAIGPGVPLSDAETLIHRASPITVTPIHPTLTLNGTELTGATITSALRLTAGRSVTTYSVTMTATVQAGQLVMTGFSMEPS